MHSFIHSFIHSFVRSLVGNEKNVEEEGGKMPVLVVTRGVVGVIWVCPSVRQSGFART